MRDGGARQYQIHERAKRALATSDGEIVLVVLGTTIKGKEDR